MTNVHVTVHRYYENRTKCMYGQYTTLSIDIVTDNQFATNLRQIVGYYHYLVIMHMTELFLTFRAIGYGIDTVCSNRKHY